MKQQLEFDEQRPHAGGVVRDAGLRAEAIDSVLVVADELGWRAHWRADSDLPGKDGNVEHFAWLQRA